MARRASTKLRVHRASGRFYKCIGMVLGKDGQPKKKVWYFDSSDEAAAIARVFELKGQWKALRASGKVVWDEDAEYIAERRRGTDEASIEIIARPITVADAAKLYLGQLERQRNAGQVGVAHYESQQARLNKGVATLARLPLSVVGEQQLLTAVLALAQRPILTLHRPLSKKPKDSDAPKKTRRMSSSYAKASIATLKWFFTWCAESDQVLWTRPPLFRSIFKTRPVLTPDEQRRELDDGREIEHFTLDELTKLWSEASDLQKCLMLLGVNCAFANAECASLITAEVKGLDTDTPIIERFRQKTIKTAGRGSYARWHLWPETVTYLRTCRAAANTNHLWFLTEHDLPLTSHNAVGQGWRRLVKRAQVRPLGFKFLRKSAAHFVRNVLGCGAETADMLLAHTDAGIVKFYAGRDWDGRLREATSRLRVHLSPVFS